jgi:septum formation protein
VTAVASRPEQHRALVLASASPRRREILGQLNVGFEVIDSGADEGRPDGLDPEAYARAAAEAKALAVAERLGRAGGAGGEAFVLGADTIVVIDGAVLGKPADAQDAVRMLSLLQGREHEVITAVCLVGPAGAFSRTIAVRSRVAFRALDERTIARYAQGGEGGDKAGSYAVQGLGAGLVRAIHGSYSNVVGLPACETLELLIEAGVIGAWP